jgi:acetyl/propionyl-CoA carboxylase alpha subunit
VTELVTGIDLVRAQLLVAAGAPLPAEMLDSSPKGHAIEVRLYAEDVASGFIPVAGTLITLAFPEFDNVRVDAGFTSGSRVSTFYDPMLAKVIGYGADRDEACSRVARTLRETVVHGVATNRDLLVGILREPEFRSGAIDTGYLERHPPAELMAGTGGVGVTRTHALVAAVAAQACRRAEATVLPRLASGWRTLPSQDQMVTFTVGGDAVDVKYRFDRGRLTAAVDEWCPEIRVLSASVTLVDAEIDDVRRRYRVTRSGAMHYVDSSLGWSTLTEVERFPDPSATREAGSLLAPMPGSVVRIEVDEGAEVSAGTPIVVLEAMKMEHTVRAPADGVVATILVAAGDQVDAGQVLGVVAGDEQ